MRKYVYACLSFIIVPFSLSAQNYGGGQDDEKIHFGFMFQYISSEFKIHKQPSWRNPFFDTGSRSYITDSLMSISSTAKPGFGLGFVTNLRVSNNVDVRFTPGLAFSDRAVNYEYQMPAPGNTFTQGLIVQKIVQATNIDLPVGIKVKSDQRKNYRAYILAGIKYSTNIVSKKKTDDSGNAPIDKLLKSEKSFLSYEAGIGFDFYFEFFKMSPELKFSQSAKSVLKPEQQPYAYPLERLFLRNIQFSLFFE